MRAKELPRTRFVGRSEELALVRSSLAAGGCVIAGAAGVGKSRLASEAVRGHVVLRVLATHSAAALPFGAFAHLLPVTSQSGAEVIPAFIAMLRARQADARTVVLVDDAHLLDEASAALVLALATTGVARPVVTVRSPERVPDAITALWTDQGIERLDLQRLGRLDVADLVRAELHGTVQPRVVTRIADLSLGSPLYIRELMRDARRTGALEQVGDEWLWREELLAFDGLSALIQQHTGTVGSEARRALEYVSIVERLPMAVLATLTSEPAVEELERELLIRVGPGAVPEVSVAHPLYAEVVAAGLPRTTTMRLRREVAAALADSGADVLRVAALLLDAGAPEVPMFLEASSLALRAGGVRLSLRFAEAAGDSLAAALTRAAALVDLGRFDDVEPVLAPHESSAAAAVEASSDYLWARSRALLRGSGADQTRADLLDRAATWHEGVEWDALLAGEAGWAALYDGRPADGLRHIEPFIDDERVNVQHRFFMAMMAMNAHYRLARFHDITTAYELCRRLAESMENPPATVRVGLLTGSVFPAIHRAVGLDAAQATLEAAHSEAVANGDRSLQTAASMLLGDLALRRGHATTALAHLEESVEALGEADTLNEALNEATMHTYALALHGDTEKAAALVEAIEKLAQAQPRNARKHIMQIEVAHAQADGVAGRTTAAITRLLAAADAGYNDIAGEITALYDALRQGADPRVVAAGLRPRLVDAQHELGELMLDHADALSRADAPAQLDVAKRFHDCGCDLYAAEAAARASRAFTETGRAALSREAAALAARYAAPCGQVLSWALQQRPEGPKLTKREREIAVLAARGRTNKEIADDLVLSVRTVESYLLNACQKLGVANRRALADVISLTN